MSKQLEVITVKILCIRMWTAPEAKEIAGTSKIGDKLINLKSEDCNPKLVSELVTLLIEFLLCTYNRFLRSD